MLLEDYEGYVANCLTQLTMPLDQNLEEFEDGETKEFFQAIIEWRKKEIFKEEHQASPNKKDAQLSTGIVDDNEKKYELLL